MGEIADGLVDGTYDFYTGEYLGEGPGFPRTHNKSLPWERGYDVHRHRGQRYRHAEFTDEQKVKGVLYWLYDKGIKGEEAHNTVKAWAAANNFKPLGKHRAVSQTCIEIQKDFLQFVKWFKGTK